MEFSCEYTIVALLDDEAYLRGFKAVAQLIVFIHGAARSGIGRGPHILQEPTNYRMV
jgi:hypothetical protein